QNSFFVKTDKSLWAMGYNGYGQLGNGTKTRLDDATKLMEGVKSVSSKFYHTLVVREDGSLWGTGNNQQGLLGDGTTTERLSFFKIVDSGVVKACAGERHSLFIKDDGSLWGMGGNNYGELGLGS